MRIFDPVLLRHLGMAVQHTQVGDDGGQRSLQIVRQEEHQVALLLLTLFRLQFLPF